MICCDMWVWVWMAISRNQYSPCWMLADCYRSSGDNIALFLGSWECAPLFWQIWLRQSWIQNQKLLPFSRKEKCSEMYFLWQQGTAVLCVAPNGTMVGMSQVCSQGVLLALIQWGPRVCHGVCHIYQQNRWALHWFCNGHETQTLHVWDACSFSLVHATWWDCNTLKKMSLLYSLCFQTCL